MPKSVSRVMSGMPKANAVRGAPFPSRPMAGEGSFGHYGMGGSMAFAHPARGLSFGYTMNQMLSPSGPDPRSTALIQAVLRCAG